LFLSINGIAAAMQSPGEWWGVGTEFVNRPQQQPLQATAAHTGEDAVRTRSRRDLPPIELRDLRRRCVYDACAEPLRSGVVEEMHPVADPFAPPSGEGGFTKNS
jgi:hypothetical protein